MQNIHDSKWETEQPRQGEIKNEKEKPWDDFKVEMEGEYTIINNNLVSTCAVVSRSLRRL